jgi:hypothetical protein
MKAVMLLVLGLLAEHRRAANDRHRHCANDKHCVCSCANH